MSSIRNALALGALSALVSAQKLDAPCNDVVIFMARGNNAPYHDDRTFPFVDATCGKLRAEGKSCDYIEVQYDVTLGGDYCAQVAEGARNGISEITRFNAKCPNTHIVVNGYSEGAHVMGDVLGGPGGCSKVSSGIDPNSAAGKAIAAALLWGDVMHTANQPYNVLDGASRQKNPRSAADLALLNRYASILRSYCAAGDPVCAGGNTVADHLNYFQLYTDDASSWVVSMINKLQPAPSSTPSGSSPTATSSVPGNDGSAPTATSNAPGATATGGSGAGYPTGGAYPTTTASEVAPTSKPSAYPPFPAPVPYENDTCVLICEVKYVYA